MATTQREERALLGHDAYKLIEPSHYPALGALSGEELRTLATRLREQHAKARDLIREGKRAKRGKGDARAAATAEAGKATRRKQVYAAALKRVNARFDEIDHERKRAAHRAALKAALARKQATRAAHPQGGFSAGKGMRASPSGKGRGGVNPSRIGSVSQQNKAAQARRDG
ncbi:hypothetical protein DFH01_01055 [Falsiroseomonas bella]|uniref:Uncharacterized protein n=1 Tax=Falsiroseomonas bella TaxID=2184016 RepID=A0A317FK15_9PROT|nr:hypothetical protein [Falsiroseomonas bella]PWS37936.1 hypothetical protein DFH01_01055 [Falsiroseomonas bella]